jgi:hypothetical protein
VSQEDTDTRTATVAQDAYNEAVADANAWLGEIASEIDDYISERSEKWQDSERGQAYRAWHEVFTAELEDVELDEPDVLELETGDQVEALDCPEEVDLA